MTAPPRPPPLPTRGQRIAAAIESVSAADFTDLGLSVWIGPADGDALYEESAGVPRPAASSIKTAYLVEFFSDRAETLDEAVPGAAQVVGVPNIRPLSISTPRPRPRSRNTWARPLREPSDTT